MGIKELIIFDNNNNESARFEIPAHHKGSTEYNWIRWKYGSLHAKDPDKYHCWQTSKDLEPEESPDNSN